MQLASQNNDFIEFKDEIYKKMRLIENKFLSELNSKFAQINSSFEKMDIRINTVSQNNNSLLDLVTKQNFNFEKVNQFDIYKSKTDQTLITQKIQLKNILQEINKMKDNYEKIVTENLTIPGCIGPGSIYKNLSDYLVYEMNEFNKLRNDIEQNKKKVGDWEKTAINIISNALFRFQSYTDNKNKQMHVLFDKKFGAFNSKILDIETQIERFQPKLDKFMKSVQNEIIKIIRARNTYNEDIEKKFEEINQKIDSLIQDLESFKNKKFQAFNKNKENNFLDSSKSITANLKFLGSNKNITKINKNIGTSNFKNQLQEKNITNNLSNKDDDQKNSSIINNINNNENFSQIFSDLGSPKRKNTSSQFNNNESKNNNNEEKKSPISPEKLRKEQVFKKGNNINNQQYITIKRLEDINIMDDKIDNTKTDNIKNINPSINPSINLSKDIEIIEESEKSKKYIDKATNVGNNLQKNVHQKTDSKIWMANNKTINKEKNIITNNKIQINSLNKQKEENKSNNLSLKEYQFTLGKNEPNDETIKSVKLNKTNSMDNFQKTERKEFKNKEIIIIPSKNSSSSSVLKQINTKEDINIELNNKENINLKAFIPPKNYNTTSKENKGNVIPSSKNKKMNFQMNVNIEQQKIMSKIREYYNSRQKQTERRSYEKIVDCNLINLNLRPLSKNNRNSSYSTPRNSFYTSNYSKLNKVSNFGKTNYIFYSKRERYSRARSLNSFDNKNNS